MVGFVCRYEVGRFKEIERNREEIPVLELNEKDVLKLEERVYEARATAKAVSYIMCKEVMSNNDLAFANGFCKSVTEMQMASIDVPCKRKHNQNSL